MAIIKKYGKIGIITHLTISWSILGALYLIVKRTGQAPKIIKYFKLEKWIPNSAGDFSMALAIYKGIMPGRLALSLLAIPLVANYFDVELSENGEQQKLQQEKRQ